MHVYYTDNKGLIKVIHHYLKQLSLPLDKSSVTSEFTPSFTGGKTSEKPRVNLQSGTFHLLKVY